MTKYWVHFFHEKTSIYSLRDEYNRTYMQELVCEHVVSTSQIVTALAQNEDLLVIDKVLICNSYFDEQFFTLLGKYGVKRLEVDNSWFQGNSYSLLQKEFRKHPTLEKFWYSWDITHPHHYGANLKYRIECQEFLDHHRRMVRLVWIREQRAFPLPNDVIRIVSGFLIKS